MLIISLCCQFALTATCIVSCHSRYLHTGVLRHVAEDVRGDVISCQLLITLAIRLATLVAISSSQYFTGCSHSMAHAVGYSLHV